LDKNTVSNTPAPKFEAHDAIRTVIAVCENISEDRAEQLLSEWLDADKSAFRPHYEELVKGYGHVMEGIPPTARRYAIVWAALRAKRKAEMEAIFKSPAVAQSKLIRVASLVFPREEVVQRFVPLLSDYHIAICDAVNGWERFLARGTYYVAFVRAMNLNFLLNVLDRLIRLWQLLP
jgi:hypothetical protein